MASDKSVNALWFLALIIILMASMVIWAAFSLRTDMFSEALKREDTLSVILLIDDGEQPLLSEILYYHPVTRNSALVAIPEETGTLLSSVDRVARLETLYDPQNLTPYKEAVGALMGHPLDFMIRLEAGDFEHLVDFLGGIDIFIPGATDSTVDGVRYLFAPGSIRLDGGKARSYAQYKPPGELISERTEREHRLVQSLFRSVGESGDLLTSDDVFPYIEALVDSEMDGRSLKSFFTVISSLNTERMVFQGIIGNRRQVDGQDLLFPYYDGKLIRETVQRISETLGRADVFGDDLLTIRVEILNGTDVNGLASRTAQLYRSYGFRIASVSNASGSDYERTVVLDRQGNPDAAERVAGLIRCQQIYSQVDENRDETVDITVILGKDFDGRYVKN